MGSAPGRIRTCAPASGRARCSSSPGWGAPLAGFEPALPRWRRARSVLGGERPWQDSNRAVLGRVLGGERPWQDSNLRSRLRRAVLYPLSYRGSGCGREVTPTRTAFRHPGEGPGRASLGLTGDARPALRRHRCRPDHAGRGGHAAPARRRADRGGRGASAEQGARRLRDQRGAAAGEEGGHAAARARAVSGRGAGRDRRHREGRHRRAGLPEHHRRPPEPRARWPPTSSPPVRRTARRETFAGERINLEFVSANPTGPLHIGGTRWAAVGDALGRIFTMPAPRSPGSTTSTTTAARSTGSPTRCSPAPRVSRCPRTATAGITSTTSPRRSWQSSPASSTCPRTSAVRSSAPRACEMMFAEIKQEPARLRRRLRRLLPRGQPARRAVPSSGPWSGSPSWATSTSRTARSGCAPNSSVTTRTGWSSGRTARGTYLVRGPGLLPRQARARLRPLLHHARRRPPRLRRPDDGDVCSLRRRPGVRTSRS